MADAVQEQAVSHIHALVIAEGLTAANLAELRSTVRSYKGEMKAPQRELRNYTRGIIVDRRNRWIRPFKLRIPVEVSTRTYETRRESDLRRFLRCLQKSTMWAEPYRAVLGRPWPEPAPPPRLGV